MLVVMTEDAIENYGKKYRGTIFKVTHTATKYMSAKEFFAKGRPEDYHPGYDSSVGNKPLYDFIQVDNGVELPFSLYSWEVEKV